MLQEMWKTSSWNEEMATRSPNGCSQMQRAEALPPSAEVSDVVRHSVNMLRPIFKQQLVELCNPYIWKLPAYHSEYAQRRLLLYLCPMCLLWFDFVFGWERERGNTLTFSHAFIFYWLWETTQTPCLFKWDVPMSCLSTVLGILTESTT